MKLGRISINGPDGSTARLVALQAESGRVIDLRQAERQRLEQQGATSEAALRLATALFPSSMGENVGNDIGGPNSASGSTT